MANQKKIEAVKELTEKINKAQSIVLVDYKGIKVAEDTDLRKEARNNNVEYLVAKNRLFLRALKEAGIEADFTAELEGTTAFAFGYEDAVEPAKVVFEFGKDKEIFNIKAGLLEGKKLNASEVEALAKLPSKEELLAKMLSSMQSPISGFVNVLQGTIRGFVVALNAIKEQKDA